MQTTNDPRATLGAALAGNPAVQASIEAILDQLRTAQAALTGACPPESDHVESYEALLERAGEVRGRKCLYPYLGTGLGNGPLVQLADGSVKWDMINGIGVHMFGHSHPEMVRAALESATSDVVMQGNLQFNADSIQLSELLVKEAGRTSGIKHCFMTNSGAMANESALKVCQQKTGAAPRIIAFADCFMGRSTTMAQIGDSAGGRVGIPMNTHVDYMPYWDPALGERSIDHAVWHLDQVIKRYPGQHSCFVFELTQGEGGFVEGGSLIRFQCSGLLICCCGIRARSSQLLMAHLREFLARCRQIALKTFAVGLGYVQALIFIFLLALMAL